MKSAYFEYDSSFATVKRVLRGKVTLHDDGKITVNLIDGRMASAESRYRAKAYGEKIAKEGFVEPKIWNVEEINIDQKLINVLRTETQSLKQQYIQFTKEYATKKFAWAAKIWAMNIIQLYDHFEIPYTMVDSGFKTKDGAAMRPQIADTRDAKLRRKQMDATVREARDIHSKGYDIFEANEVKFAERHYEDSLKKLAMRIEKKQLNLEKLQVTSGHVGVNFHTVLTDTEQSVKAFTVIASGPVQRPHYRYLVK